MLRNGQDIDNGSVLSTDVCIIGSGPAGVTAAWRLAKAGVGVILLDGSRELDYQQPGVYYEESWDDKAEFYGGTYTDDPDNLFRQNEPHFLVLPYDGPHEEWDNIAWERERVYGGTSTHWAGQSRPLDPITFEKRPGFPGWPIDRKDLDPYYAQAVDLMKLYGNYAGEGSEGEIQGYNFTAEFWAGVLDASVPKLEGFEAKMYQFAGGDPDRSPPTNYRNFVTRGFAEFQGHPIGSPQSPVDVIVNATLLDIEHDNGTVSGLRVASLYDAKPGDSKPPLKKKAEFTVRAKVYLLACGAVANARQLLLSKIGGDPDSTLVGRYFMCHPLSATKAVCVSQDDYLDWSEQRLMSGWTTRSQWIGPNQERVEGRFAPCHQKARKEGIGRCWFWPNGGQYYFEMQPNPDSRVKLSKEIEPVFNQPRTEIDWKLTPLDQKTYETTTDWFRIAVRKIKKDATVVCNRWDNVRKELIVNGHHIGTTRMSETADEGVVDPNLRVHGLDNLYVAGSSVFPTTGITNPTFTIIALSIRLGEHLAGKFTQTQQN